LRYAEEVSDRSEIHALDDAALARRIASAGTDVHAEAELYRRLAPRVRLYGLRHLRDAHAAADLMQQVMLMTVERLRAGKLRDPERLASFVLGMCRLVVLDWRRGNARRERLLNVYGDDLSPDEVDGPQTVDRERLLHCVEQLSERERTVLVSTFFEDKAAAALAGQLGLSEVNVRVIRHRGLGRLRACMEGASERR
jgi:RNA polymerase sigma-70 factor (ECF subfamily)